MPIRKEDLPDGPIIGIVSSKKIDEHPIRSMSATDHVPEAHLRELWTERANVLVRMQQLNEKLNRIDNEIRELGGEP